MPDDTPRGVEALERERLEADRRYNDALTAADAAIVRATGAPPPVISPAITLPPIPAGWRGHLLRIVHEWLAPLVSEQRAFNERFTAELSASAERERDAAIALERFETALVVFLQQITAFVDTKVRVADASASSRIAASEQTVATIPELRAQVETLQRTVQSLKRWADTTINAEAATPETEPTGFTENAKSRQRVNSASSALKSSAVELTYVGFEDRFRGSDEAIREKQSAYLPVFAGASDVLDIGCGRGEFLALLATKGVSARGVDVNEEMVAVARDRGLDAMTVDALSYVSALDDDSLGGVMCAQVIEHLEPAYLIRLLETLSHKLRPGAPVVIETINPACWLAFFSSYIRDFTHVRPIHPETLEYLLHASGFGRVSIRYSAPVPEHMKMAPVHLPPEVTGLNDPVAHALSAAADVVNANATILNTLMFTYMDYAAIAFRS